MYTTQTLLVNAFVAVAVAQQYASGTSAGYGYGSLSSTPATMQTSEYNTGTLSASVTTTPGAVPSASSTHTIQVGEGGLVFNPASTSAAAGDVLLFVFNPMNHSVVQSNFANPCEPISDSVKGSEGFFSGFMAVAAGGPTKDFSITVPDTNPIWYYCAQAQHCQAGMVGVVNPPASSSMDVSAFAALASKATGAAPPTSVVSTVALASASSSGATAAGTSATSSAASSSTSKGGAQPTLASCKELYAVGAMAGMAALAVGF